MGNSKSFLQSPNSNRHTSADPYPDKERILMVGLDAAGKTTILYGLALGEVSTTIPTIGFNIEEMKGGYQNHFFTAWDVGGRDKIRPLWRYYYQNTGALIFVIDSNDIDRFKYVLEELNRMLAEDELRDCPLLVLANKQDLPNAMSVETIIERLELNKLKNRQWYCHPCSATADIGTVKEGLKWLMSVITFDHDDYKVSCPVRVHSKPFWQSEATWTIGVVKKNDGDTVSVSFPGSFMNTTYKNPKVCVSIPASEWFPGICDGIIIPGLGESLHPTVAQDIASFL